MKELLSLPKDKAPAFITMVDIDEVVMEACAEYMPAICGEYLKKENWNAPNYRIFATCAIQFMKDCQVSRKIPFLCQLLRQVLPYQQQYLLNTLIIETREEI